MPLVARWVASDSRRVRAALAAALGVEPHADGSITVAGLRLEIADADLARGGRDTDRLEIEIAQPVPASMGSDVPGPPVADSPSLRAVGWATVDIERAAGAWRGVRWNEAARDSLVGARALVGELTGSDAGWFGGTGRHPGSALAPTPPGLAPGGLAPPGLAPPVLLEPDTEGRLAAALARHGEGPAVLYFALPEAAVTRARWRLEQLGIVDSTGTGPFGPQVAIAGRPAWSPTVVLLTRGQGDAIGPDGGPAAA